MNKIRRPRVPIKYTLKKNAGLIFSILGIGGVITTGVLGVRAGMKAEKILKDLDPDGAKGRELIFLQAKATWKCYVWVIMSVIASSGCIIASHRISAKQIAALSSFAAAGATTLNQYRDKVREIIGQEQEQEIYDEALEESKRIVKTEYLKGSESDEIEVEYYDMEGKRFFKCTPSKAYNARYLLTMDYISNGIAFVNHWYEYIGLPGIDDGDKIGWANERFYYPYYELDDADFLQAYQLIETQNDLIVDGKKVTGWFFATEPNFDSRPYKSKREYILEGA